MSRSNEASRPQRRPAPRRPTLAADRPHSPPGEDLTPVLGANLRRLRTDRGLSLERLAELSGVSRAMLSQVELGQSTPTINVLWKISKALEVAFSALISARKQEAFSVLREEHSKILSSHDGGFTSRALFPFDNQRRTEFYELRLRPGAAEHAEPHAPGTLENLAVSAGSVAIELGADRAELARGDAILFQADVPHVYRNTGPSEAVLFLVMSYAEAVG